MVMETVFRSMHSCYDEQSEESYNNQTISNKVKQASEFLIYQYSSIDWLIDSDCLEISRSQRAVESDQATAGNKHASSSNVQSIGDEALAGRSERAE